ncbi:FGGY family carbohydrate kinase [Nocardiopsis sediminis]|uniref:FGGY family carbohydrate kinase n=1 Tax=Nocardiopsis sediminis TaxID=1778267 RepID=A0ABV8FRE2_9ACTN
MFVGIDIGTTITKAVAFDEDGTETAVATSPTRLRTPSPGHYEHDVEEIVQGVGRVAAEVAGGTAPRAVGITAQGDGLWLTDEAGDAVRPAISWMDARATPVVRRWMADGTAAEVYARCGGMVFPGAAAPLLAALAETEPETLRRAATAGYCKDVVMQRLTGVRATDVSDASMPFLDPRTRAYDPAVLEACGLGGWDRLLAPVAPAHGPLAPLSDGGLTALPEGTPVSCGPYDLPAAAMGAGVVAPGDALITIGTTLACQVVTADPAPDGVPAGLLLGTWTPGRWLRAMPAMVGTAALDRVLALVGARPADLSDLLAQSPPGARGVTALPFWSPAGERAPFVEPAARGSFDGIDLATSPADLVRAVCEAVAYAGRHCLEAAGWTGRVVVCGGGARTDGWAAIFASVLGRPLHAAPGAEVGARGAVLGAMAALGHPADLDGWTATARVHDPDPALAAFYDEGYAHYLTRVAAARERWSAEHATPTTNGDRIR